MPEPHSAKERHEIARARISEARAAALERKLIRRDQAEALFQRLGSHIRNELDRATSYLDPALDGPSREVCERAVRQAVEVIGRRLADVVVDEELA